jgi:hypothetical protein
LLHLSQIIGALLKLGHSVEFDPIDQLSMVTVRSKDNKCLEQAVGPTANIALNNLLERAKKNRTDAGLVKLASELLGDKNDKRE